MNVKDIYSLLSSNGQAPENEYLTSSVAHQLVPLIEKLSDPSRTKCYSTGFEKLDKLLGGGFENNSLTIIGGVCGMGKTTMALQMAYHIATTQKQDVLFFALEMSEEQMLTKLLSMVSAQLARKCINWSVAGLTREQLRNTEAWETLSPDEFALLQNSFSELQRATHLYIKAPATEMTAFDIVKTVEAHITQTGNTPVIFVDYLHNLCHAKCGTTEKQVIDEAVQTLKTLSQKHDTAVIALSSLNRAAYHDASIGSASGSGKIEYAASTLLLLTPPQGALEKKPELMPSARSTRSSRPLPTETRVHLTCVKNRFQQKNVILPFDFLGQYSYFVAL